MIYATGDTHGGWTQRLKADVFPEQKRMTKDDYVIILGDFGIWNNSRQEKYNLNWLEQKPFTTLFVSGNHENYDILDSLPVEHWHGGKVNFLRPSVIHLMRGQVFEISGRTFFTFGGASSHDISSGILDPTAPDFKRRKKLLDKDPTALYRINHISWWERELPSSEEMQEGIDNLKKHNSKVDYIITHSPSTSLLKLVDSEMLLYKSDYLTDYLDEIQQNVEYRHFLFGHMHINKTFKEMRSVCLYEQIVRIL